MLPSLSLSLSGVSARPSAGPVSNRPLGSQSERSGPVVGLARQQTTAQQQPQQAQVQTTARFFPHLGPAPTSLSLKEIQGVQVSAAAQTDRRPTKKEKKQPAAATMPVPALAPKLVHNDSTSSDPHGYASNSGPAIRKAAAMESAAAAAAGAGVGGGAAPSSGSKTKKREAPKKHTSVAAMEVDKEARVEKAHAPEESRVDVPEEKVASIPSAVTDQHPPATRSPVASARTSPHTGSLRRVSVEYQLNRSSTSSPAINSAAGAMTRVQPVAGTSVASAPSAAGHSPPAHVRRVSVNIHDVLESPRLNSLGSAGATRPARKSSATHSPPTMVRRDLPGSRTASRGASRGGQGGPAGSGMEPPPASSSESLQLQGKPCSVLECTNARVEHEGYCKVHLSDIQHGVKMKHKRSGSILERLLNPNQHRPAHRTGGYGATRAAHSTGDQEMHHAGIGTKHGLADVSPYHIMGIQEEHAGEEKATPTKDEKKSRMQRAAERVHASSAATTSAAATTVTPDAAPATTPPGSTINESNVGLPSLSPKPTHPSGARRFSQSKPLSTSSDWMHPPSTQAARALRAAMAKASGGAIPSKAPKRHPTEESHGHARNVSYALPLEPLPTVDLSLAQLPFQRFYFGLPPSLDAFLAFRDRVSSAPEGAAVCLVMALLLWSEGRAVREREEARKLLGLTAHVTPEEEERLEREEARRRRERVKHEEKNATDLPLHVINTAGARQAKKPRPGSSATAAAAGQPTQRLKNASRISSLHPKKVQLTASGGGGGGEDADQSTFDDPSTTPWRAGLHSEWTMDMRWMALIACIHPDQTIEVKRGAVPDGVEMRVPAFRSRSLCSIDVQAMEDAFDTCPHLARSYVLGTTAQNDFAMPDGLPPLTPPQDARKLKFSDPTLGVVGEHDDDAMGLLDDSKACLAHLAEGCGPIVIRVARHPFAAGTADHSNHANPFCLLMVHNAGLRYPRSIKLRKDSTGRWRVVHWFNLLGDIPIGKEAKRERE